MAINFNNAEVTRLIYNAREMCELKYNGALIFDNHNAENYEHIADRKWGVCQRSYCGRYISNHEHYTLDSTNKCGRCGQTFPSLTIASSFDTSSDDANPNGALDQFTLNKGPLLSDIHQRIDCSEDITDENGNYQEGGGSSHYMHFFEYGTTGPMPYPHVYCYEGSKQYLYYTTYGMGLYELIFHVRLKDEVLRGAKITINKGQGDLERVYAISHAFSNMDAVKAARNNDLLQGAYIKGLIVELTSSNNTIHIECAPDITKTIHFRDIYLKKIADFHMHDIDDTHTCTTCGKTFSLTAEQAEQIGLNYVEGSHLPDNYWVTLTLNKEAPNASNFFRVNVNGRVMSVKLANDNQSTRAKQGDTVVIRGKLGCANSTVNGTYGREARIYDAYVVENKTAPIFAYSHYYINNQPTGLAKNNTSYPLTFESLSLGSRTSIKTNFTSTSKGKIYYDSTLVYNNTSNDYATRGWSNGTGEAEDRLITLENQRVDSDIAQWISTNAQPAYKIDGVSNNFQRESSSSVIALVGKVRVGTSYSDSSNYYFTIAMTPSKLNFSINKVTYSTQRTADGYYQVYITAGDLGTHGLPIVRAVNPTYFSSSKTFVVGAEKITSTTPNPWTLIVQRAIWATGDYGIVRYTNIYGEVVLKQIPEGTDNILINDVMPNSEIGLSAEYIKTFGQAISISGLTYTGMDGMYGLYTMDQNGAVAYFYNAS